MDTLRRLLPAPIKNVLRPLYHGFFDFLRFLVRAIFRHASAILGRKGFLRLAHFLRREAVETIVSFGFRMLVGDEYVNTTNISWTNVRNYFLVRE